VPLAAPIVLAACWVTMPDPDPDPQPIPIPSRHQHPGRSPWQAVINFSKFIHFDKHLADDSRTQLTAFAYVFAAFMAMSEMSGNTQHGHTYRSARLEDGVLR